MGEPALTPEELARLQSMQIGQPMGAPLGVTAPPIDAMQAANDNRDARLAAANDAAASVPLADQDKSAELERINKGRHLWGAPALQELTGGGKPLFQAPQFQTPADVQRAEAIKSGTLRDPTDFSRDKPDLSPIAAAMRPQAPQLSYPPARFVPGQWVGSSRVIEGGREVPNAAKFAQNAGLTQQGDAAEISSAANQVAAKKEMAHLEAVSDQLDDQQKAIAERRARNDLAYQAAQSHYQDSVRQAAEVGDVNPNRFFATRGAGPQLMAIIGVALGAAGASLTGGPNTAAQLIEGAIDRDIQAQRDNIAKAQGNVQAARGVLADMRERFGDERQADIAAKDAALGVAETRIKALMADAKSEDARARGMEILGQIQEKRGQLVQNWSALEQGKIRTAEKYVPGHMVGGPPGGKAQEAPDDGRNVTTPDGTVYRMPSAKEGMEMRKRIAYVGEMHKIANRVDALRSKAGAYIGNTETSAELQALKTDYMLAYQHAHGIQRLTDKDIEVIDHAIGDPNSISSRSGQRFKLAADNAEHGVLLALKAGGAKVVNEGYGTDANGNVLPTETYAARDVASANAPPGFRSVDGSQPQRFHAPATKGYDPSKVAVELKKRAGAKGRGKAAPQADEDYESPADDGGDE